MGKEIVAKEGGEPALVKKDMSIKTLLTGDDFTAKVSKVIPKYITPERFVQVAVNCITKTPKLLDCTPQSFFGSLMNLAQFGLTPNGRDAHLVPYGKECTLNIDYKGYVKLALRNGNIRKVFADVICENDEFVYDLGRVVRHVPNFKDRGKMYAVYATVTFNDGAEESMVLTKDEVDAVRKVSKTSDSGPWVTNYNEMAKKTAFRRLCKWLDVGGDDYGDEEEEPLPMPSSATHNAHAIFADEITQPRKLTNPAKVSIDDLPPAVEVDGGEEKAVEELV